MLFPKVKMSHTWLFRGNKSKEGWLVLDIGNIELDGVNKIYIDLRDVEEIKQRKDLESGGLGDLKRLLGGE